MSASQFYGQIAGFYEELTRSIPVLSGRFVHQRTRGDTSGVSMSEPRTKLPPANDGSSSVSDFNDKAQAYFRLAAEHIQRATKTTDPKLTAGFLQLARKRG